MGVVTSLSTSDVLLLLNSCDTLNEGLTLSSNSSSWFNKLERTDTFLESEIDEGDVLANSKLNSGRVVFGDNDNIWSELEDMVGDISGYDKLEVEGLNRAGKSKLWSALK